MSFATNPLNDHLMEIGPGTWITGRNLCEHILVVGSPGSGKTTDLLLLMKHTLEHGYPLVYHCIKPEDFDHLLRVLDLTKTTHRLRVIGDGGTEKFDCALHEFYSTGQDPEAVVDLTSC